MSSAPVFQETFFAALNAAGIPEVPREFSVVPRHLVIPSSTLAGIARFIGVFDHVTNREAWRARALREAPPTAQLRRPEVCFFSAWDFHLSPEGGSQLIEFNDNGSGFLFAAIINALYYEVARLGQDRSIAAPTLLSAFENHIVNLVQQEARAFLGECPTALFLSLMMRKLYATASSEDNSTCFAISSAGRGGRLKSDVQRRPAGTVGDYYLADSRSHSSSIARRISFGNL